MARLRVDTIPLLWRPLFLAVSALLAGAALLTAFLVRLTCKVEYRGGSFETSTPTVFCGWHDSIIPTIVARAGHPFRNQVWMNHPAWFMKPVHLILDGLGVDHLVLGSSGNGGQEAARQLVEELQAGWSTIVYVDGPAGPARQLKRGALHMAQQAGVPLVAVRVVTSAAWVLRGTWDQKRVPLPFSTIVFEFSAPIAVGSDLAASEAALRSAL